MYFFVFRLFVFYCFFDGNRPRLYSDHKQDKINWVWLVKLEIMIHLWILAKNTICIGFVHKFTFLSNFGSTCTYEMLRNFGTAYPGVANLVSKVAQDLKEKSHGTARRQLFALQIYREKCRGGGLNQPPPPVFLGLRIQPFFSMLFPIVKHIIKAWDWIENS